MELLCICTIYEWFSDRDNWKDFLVPTLAIVGTIWGAFSAANRQVLNQQKIERDKERETENTLIELVSVSNGKMSKNLRDAIDKLNSSKGNFSMEKFVSMEYHKFSSTLFETVRDVRYDQIFKISEKGSEEANNNFINYWNVLSNVPNYYQDIHEYNLYVNNTFNNLNHELNEISHKVSVVASQIIHGVFEPYTTVNLLKDDISDNPPIRLAHLALLVTKEFKDNTADIRLLKIKKYFEGLDRIKHDPVASKVLPGEFAQNVVNGLAILESMGKLFDTAKKSYGNYIETLNKSFVYIESCSLKPKW